MKKFINGIAKVVGFIASAFFLSLVIDEGLDRFSRADPLLFTFIPWLLLALVGYGLAWVKPSLGGRISLLAGLLMFSFHISRWDWFTATVYGLPYIFSGVLFIVSAPTARRSSGFL